jgi:putative heme iron utilization protein
MIRIGVAVTERGNGGARGPNLWDLMREWGDVIQIIKKTWKNVTPIVIGCFILKHFSSLSSGFKFSFRRFRFD